MKHDPRIQDIPSIQKVLLGIKGLTALRIAMPLLRPILKAMGVDVNQFEKGLIDVEQLGQMAEEVACLPDRFNTAFAQRGWIAYDLLNVDIAKAAVTKAEAGDINGAETDLVEYYSVETVQWKLRTFHGVKAFRPRMPLAQKALTDYQEERYHACVPVVLALMDGLVNELHEQRRGMSAAGVQLEAWDSIAAHNTGLNELTRVMMKTRQTTRTDQISIPYRNGILHGMDLGYDNKTVAAKTWAALFAVREWALKAEQGLTTAPPAEPKPPWRERLKRFAEQAQDHEDTKARLAAWSARSIQLGEDVPTTGEPDVFNHGSPEQRLAAFLSYWKARNYGQMAQCFPTSAKKSNQKALPGKVRAYYTSKYLREFEFLSVEDEAPAVTVVKVKLDLEEAGNSKEQVTDARMIYEDEHGQPLPRGKPGGSWVVYTYYM